jgi:peptidyl-tRNA hydrolase, PTH1 family
LLVSAGNFLGYFYQRLFSTFLLPVKVGSFLTHFYIALTRSLLFIFALSAYPESPIFAAMKFLIVGLGNVGTEYEHTRHNIGFDVVMAFVQKQGGSFRQDRLAFVAEVKWKGKVFVCICPSTYMNLSGKAVKYWMDKEKIDLQNMLVIVDDVALPLAKIRIRAGGSDGGHNGLKSIQELLGTTNYAKLRFGIGNNYPKGAQADYVLGRWLKEEEPLVKKKIDASVEVIESFAGAGINNTMNKYNNIEISL